MGRNQIFFEIIIIFPDAPVRRIDRPRPVVLPVVADGRRDGAQHRKRRQRRHLGRQILVRRPFATYRGYGHQVIAQLDGRFDAAALSEEEHGLRRDGREEVHDGRGVRTAHAEVDDGDSFCRRVGHRGLQAEDGHAEVLGKQFHIFREVRQEDVLGEILQPTLRIAREPVLYNFLLSLNILIFLLPKIRKSAKISSIGLPENF